jgi:hypothetical protein
MNAADVRERLIRALRLDLVGPEPNDPQAEEVLDRAPSRWYLTGFLVPSTAPATQRSDEDDRGDFDLEASPAGDEEDATHETPAARRGYFPSSIGLSVLAPPDAEQLKVTARWGDYEPLEKDGKPTGEWRRHERQATVPIRLKGEKVDRSPAPVLDSNGLEIVTSVRRVRGLEHMPGLPTGSRAISVFLVNRREPNEGPDELRDSVFAFQVRLVVEADRPFVPRPNARGRDGNDPDERTADLQYRDIAEFAVGHGVATRSVIGLDGFCQSVETSWMPQAEVERVEAAAIQDVELGMEPLAAAPDAAALRSLLAPLPARYHAWIQLQTKVAPKDASQAEVATDLLQSASRAARRIEAGLALLDDPTALEAFRLTNRAMAMAARQRRAQERNVNPASVEPPQWRPFQLAFLLMNLQAFVTPGHTDREIVDLLFFPTGGGKTEAYFGLSAFVILLRRLRDPSPSSAGVAVLMRYTLRLLTLDQLSRASTLICALELIRQEAPEKLGAWPFEIGLWVGKAATPNRMGRKGEKDDTSARAKTIRYRNNSRKAAPIPVETCPWCGTKLKPTSFLLWPDTDNPQELKVLCGSPVCRFRGKNPLPIVAVDEPVYRRVPCFVIATVDKFASLPWVGASGALLGGADRHDVAGFYGPWQPDTGHKLPKSLTPPDLIIQDELHLISGPLGTMAGLYETAIDALCTREVEGRALRPKIVASTATVRRAADQIRALFGRSGVEIFPPPGPDRRDSFFARTVDLSERRGRVYLGVAAQGRSLKVVLLRTYLALVGAAQKAWEEAGGAKNASNPADPFMTLVGYFNSLRELGGSRRIVEDEVASRASAYGSRRRVDETAGSFASRMIARDVAELTSREPTDRVSDTKRRLALGFSDKEHVDVALATNMISVGLDITRLGLMVVLGQPKATAEYIQATSRVGRDAEKPGLVVMLLNVHRPRDRSHFERFEAYHASFYRAVEATSVTPFAPRALDRALPAIVVSLGRHSRAQLAPPRGAIEIVKERTNLDSILEILSKRVRAHRALSPDEEARVTASLRARAQDLLDSWFKVGKAHRDAGARLVYQPFENTDGPPLLHTPLDPELATISNDARKFKAPRSLRDVEPSVNLWLKRLDGTEVELPAQGDEE